MNQSIRNRSTPLPARLARWFFLAVLAALSVKIALTTVGDQLALSNPESALDFQSDESVSRLLIAAGILRDDKARLGNAVENTVEALRANPLSAPALSLLATADEARSDAAGARALMTLAGRIDSHYAKSSIWLLGHDVLENKTDSALRRIDLLFRLGEQSAPLTLALAPALASAQYRAGFLRLLRGDPQWRGSILEQLADMIDRVPGLFSLFGELQAGANPLTTSELSPVLTRLIAASRFDQAYLLWKRSLPEGRLDNGEILYNGRFAYPPTGLAFDWQYDKTQGYRVEVDPEGASQILNLDFIGSRVASPFASHLLALQPGSYRFSGVARARGLENPRGVRWRMTCVPGKPVGADPDANAIMATDLLSGDSPWRDFSAKIAVPAANCRYQSLVLELPARVTLETEIRGGVSFANLVIDKM